MSDVPEGQVPRDAAFWRTVRAVEAERDAAAERSQRARCEHNVMRKTGSDPWECADCGAPDEEVWRVLEQRGHTVEHFDGGIRVTVGR